MRTERIPDGSEEDELEGKLLRCCVGAFEIEGKRLDGV